jgi:hypothetical protein
LSDLGWQKDDMKWPGKKNTFNIYVGPSGVRALPLSAGINIGGHYKWHYFLLSLSSSSGSLLILPEGIVVGF